MAPLNRAGAGRALPRPARPVTADDVTDAVLSGAWVVDLRSRAEFARGHLPGTVNVEYGTQFATYVGWLVPWDDDLVLLCDQPGRHRRGPARPGRDRHRRAGHARADPGRAAHRDVPPRRLVRVPRSGRAADRGRRTPARRVRRRAPARRAARAGAGRRRARPRACPRASSGCTAAPATGPASRPACCTGWAAASCTSTTPGTGSPSWRSRPRQDVPPDPDRRLEPSPKNDAPPGRTPGGASRVLIACARVRDRPHTCPVVVRCLPGARSRGA